MQIVRVNGRIFLENNFTRVKHNAAVYSAVINELLQRLLRFTWR